MKTIHALLTVRPEAVERYRTYFAGQPDFSLRIAQSADETRTVLQEPGMTRPVDVLILDNAIERAFDFITVLRQTYPRLIIVLVDEEADFATPGQADDISTEPFKNDDLVRRIKRLMSDRQTETLRADAMPPIREFAKLVRKASGEAGKQAAAVTACKGIGFDYVAFYKLLSNDPLTIEIAAEEGPAAIAAIIPRRASADDIVAWVAQTGHSRSSGPGDTPSHPLIVRGRFGAVSCVAVGRTNRYGVLCAFRDQPGSISQQHVMMMELISAQLALVLARE
ncbi:MAG: GAF domain-containing protein [Anaerolinea sp.]|nr:GAF domain-containing protein [Anaerolinea sp.]